MVEVIVAEDDVSESIHLSNVINFTNEVHVISILNDRTKAYQTIKTLKPAILVLDLKR